MKRGWYIQIYQASVKKVDNRGATAPKNHINSSFHMIILKMQSLFCVGKDGGYVYTVERLPYVYVLRGTRLRRGTLQQQGLCRGYTVLRWEVYSGIK